MIPGRAGALLRTYIGFAGGDGFVDPRACGALRCALTSFLPVGMGASHYFRGADR